MNKNFDAILGKVFITASVFLALRFMNPPLQLSDMSTAFRKNLRKFFSRANNFFPSSRQSFHARIFFHPEISPEVCGLYIPEQEIHPAR